MKLFGEINSVDLILNDIWMEPKNPKEGEAVSIHGSIYNAGVIPSGEVSDAVTVGFIVNGELAKIALLENILPGLENGIEISSGPILDAVSGNYIVTVIINYHDTLLHLRDNPGNNIVQKRIQILDGIPSLVKYDIYQKYDSKTNKQQITIQGKITDIFQEKRSNQKVILDIGDIKESITTDANGEFSFKTSIPFNDEPIRVSAHIEDDFSFPEYPQMILPLKMNTEQSALVIHTTSDTNDFENSTLELAIFQDSYENLFKIISTDEFGDQNMQIDDSFLTMLPANHEYIIEIYLEGRFLDAFQDDFVESAILKKEIIIPEYGQVKFRVIDEFNESQNNVTVNNWIYSSITSEDGMTEWIEMLPTTIPSEPYVAKATLSDGSVIWSEPFQLESEEKKIISIVKGGLNP
ncbi:MAG: hypothetical protein OEL84_12095 [Nitrosopumilus sp.]|nr:hypothetical protein [Nitrosopumilus sp.]